MLATNFIETIYILGGEGTLAESVENDLASYSDKVLRIKGANRFETSAKIADYFMPDASHAYLASGENNAFPDSLVIGAIADGDPILLTARNFIPGEIRPKLGKLSSLTIVGGTGTIPEATLEGANEDVTITIEPEPAPAPSPGPQAGDDSWKEEKVNIEVQITWENSPYSFQPEMIFINIIDEKGQTKLHFIDSNSPAYFELAKYDENKNLKTYTVKADPIGYYDISYDGYNIIYTSTIPDPISLDLGVSHESSREDTEVVWLDQPSVQSQAMSALRKLRGELWDKNVPYNGMTIRQAASQAGLTTKDAYVNAPKWDYNLEKIAIQRAVENAALDDLDHTRPDGSSCFTASSQGVSSFGEIIAANWVVDFGESVYSAIYDQWGYGELDALYGLNGEHGNFQGETNGHLHQLLDPERRAFAFGVAKSLEKESYVFSAGQSSSYISNPNENYTDYDGVYQIAHPTR